ncbi:hypothetical protein OIU77_007895 [Salix suchowensis]|uniref:SEC63 domain-containing protein n=1 Tax=Salix suchowensis TaxID=1278906 RepID=A0ABQ9AJ24_9ROSI|nr:hypothetical protein OIU77_007895 [Salix suchowensis]
MLPCMNELLQSLRKRGISTVQQLLDLPRATLQAMIGNFPASRFYQLKDEAWWLVLGNTSIFELYALKRVSFSDHLMTHMELPSTLTSVQGMKLILVSDCYVGFEQEHSVEELIKSQQTESR